MTWMEISCVSAAAAFIVLVGYAVVTLIAARLALQQISDAVSETRQAVLYTAEQSDRLLQEARELTADVRSGAQTLQQSLEHAQQAGAAVGEVVSSLYSASRTMSQTILNAERAVQAHKERLQDAFEWAATGVELWQRWQANRQAKADLNESDKKTNKGVHEHV